MSETGLNTAAFAKGGLVVFEIYDNICALVAIAVRLTPSQAEKLADDLGLAVEQARKARIERAS